MEWAATNFTWHRPGYTRVLLATLLHYKSNICWTDKIQNRHTLECTNLNINAPGKTMRQFKRFPWVGVFHISKKQQINKKPADSLHKRFVPFSVLLVNRILLKVIILINSNRLLTYLKTYPNRRNQTEVKKDGTVSFKFGKSMKPLYDSYWLKTLIDSHSYTMAFCKLFPDVVCLSNSCGKNLWLKT